MARGTLIVFEGLDRAGKSTQCAKLVQKLKEDLGPDKVRSMNFPDRTTPIGKMINNYLRGESQQEDHVIHLLFSANRWEAAAQIEADINAGITVVIDRYYYSGCVYSVAKGNSLLDLQWARKPDEGLPRPDICVFLDVSAEVAAQRGDYGAEKYENKEMQRRVRGTFQILRCSPDRDDFVTVDGGRPMQEVTDNVNEVVASAMQRLWNTRIPLRRVEPW